jgi:hypothetical protein
VMPTAAKHQATPAKLPPYVIGGSSGLAWGRGCHA